MAWLERFDCDHTAPAVRALWGGLDLRGALLIACLGLWLWGFEQVSGLGDIVFAGVVGEEAVMADAVEAVWQGVDEEAPDELCNLQGHALVA